MTAQEAFDRLKHLVRRQYEPVLERLLVSGDLEKAFGEVTWPTEEGAGARLAADLIRRGMLAIADRLAGEYKDWSRYHRASGDLPEPCQTAWLLWEYLGVGWAEYERLTGTSREGFEGGIEEAKSRITCAMSGPLAAISVDWLRQELEVINERAWPAGCAAIPPSMIALVRDALELRLFGSKLRDLETLRAFYLSFARLYRPLRRGNCEGVAGASFKGSQRRKREAEKERDLLEDRENFHGAEPFAEECYTLVRDASLDPKLVARLVDKTAAEVESAMADYQRAFDKWRARRKDSNKD